MHLLVGGPADAYLMCFWHRNTRKKLEILLMHKSLGPGAQMLFRHNWRKLVTFLFFFHCVGEYIWMLNWHDFFVICVLGFSLKFSRLAFLLEQFYLGSKSDPITDGFILESFVGMCLVSSSSYLHGPKVVKIAQLCFFLDEINFLSKISLRGNLVCSLKMPVLIIHKSF